VGSNIDILSRGQEKRVQEEVKRWGFSSFDQIKLKKKEIMARLDGIQVSFQNGRNVGRFEKAGKKISRIT
jgi:hypothetical protein